ncbi:MAG: sel1 repeat family protein, partial [Gammaproteobacteria bacterium]|nr:sel1 repeat family protein [Gammaproteobacteria bacterium]
MRRYLLLIPLLTLLGSSAQSDFQTGEAAFARGDFETAYRELRSLAEQGGAGAQYYLGAMYAAGQGVPQDATQAVEWYRKAAEQGHADALSRLAWMFVNGSG